MMKMVKWRLMLTTLPFVFAALGVKCALRFGLGWEVGSSRVDLQACKLEYSIVSPK